MRSRRRRRRKRRGRRRRRRIRRTRRRRIIIIIISAAAIMVFVITTIAFIITGYYPMAAANETCDSKLPISFVHVLRLYQEVLVFVVLPLWPILAWTTDSCCMFLLEHSVVSFCNHFVSCLSFSIVDCGSHRHPGLVLARCRFCQELEILLYSPESVAVALNLHALKEESDVC